MSRWQSRASNSIPQRILPAQSLPSSNLSMLSSWLISFPTSTFTRCKNTPFSIDRSKALKSRTRPEYQSQLISTSTRTSTLSKRKSPYNKWAIATTATLLLKSSQLSMKNRPKKRCQANNHEWHQRSYQTSLSWQDRHVWDTLHLISSSSMPITGKIHI